MKTATRNYAPITAGIVVLTTAVVLGAVITLGQWSLVLVMVVAAVWSARIAFRDRMLSAKDKEVRDYLRRIRP